MSAKNVSLSQATLLSNESGICAVGITEGATVLTTPPIIGLNYEAGLILDNERQMYIGTWSPINHSIQDNHTLPNRPPSKLLTGYQIEVFEHLCSVAIVSARHQRLIKNWFPFAISGAAYVFGRSARRIDIHRISYIDALQTKAVTYPDGLLISLSEPMNSAEEILLHLRRLRHSVLRSQTVHIMGAEELESRFGHKEVWTDNLQSPRSRRGLQRKQ